jgi:hypothetical protein
MAHEDRHGAPRGVPILGQAVDRQETRDLGLRHHRGERFEILLAPSPQDESLRRQHWYLAQVEHGVRIARMMAPTQLPPNCRVSRLAASSPSC